MVNYTLITKNFGRFDFRTKFRPTSKTSEIFCVRNLKAFKIFRDLIMIQKYFAGPISLYLDENIPT